jgi:hypothetical protein
VVSYARGRSKTIVGRVGRLVGDLLERWSELAVGGDSCPPQLVGDIGLLIKRQRDVGGREAFHEWEEQRAKVVRGLHREL